MNICLDGSGKTCTTMGNLHCEEPIYCTGTGSIDCLDKCPGSKLVVKNISSSTSHLKN